MRHNRFVASVLIPALALLILFIAIPIVGSFVISLLDYLPGRDGNSFLGLENYKRLFSDSVYVKAVTNSLTFVLTASAINIGLAVLLAQAVSNIRRRVFRNLSLVLIFLPCVAPMVNSAVVWHRSLFPTKVGLFNIILSFLGLPQVEWISDPQVLMISIIMFSVWADVGFNTILLTAGMEAIPKDFYEAADIDGASSISRFFRITIPLLGRTFSFITAMTLISHFQMFAQFMIFARSGGSGNSGRVLTSHIYYVGFTVRNMGYASAISVTLFFIIMIFTVVQQRLNRVDWGY